VHHRVRRGLRHGKHNIPALVGARADFEIFDPNGPPADPADADDADATKTVLEALSDAVRPPRPPGKIPRRERRPQ